MGVASGHLHKGRRAAFGGAPTFVETIMVDEQAESIAKTYANAYEICVYAQIFKRFAISLIFCSHPIHPSLMHKPASSAESFSVGTVHLVQIHLFQCLKIIMVYIYKKVNKFNFICEKTPKMGVFNLCYICKQATHFIKQAACMMGYLI